MNTSLVTTNLRVPASDWKTVRVLAAEMGVSVNDFVKKAIQEYVTKKTLGTYQNAEPKVLKLRDFPRLAQKIVKRSRGIEISDDDAVIYGTKKK